MSEAVASPFDCCVTCDTPASVATPGNPGAPGAPATNGTNGINAFTTLTADFTMPAEGASDNAAVADSRWITVGQKVYLGKSGSGSRGTFEATAKPTDLSVTLKNIENTASSAYLENSPAGTIFPTASQLSPAGLQGPAGAVAGGALLAANNLGDVASAPASRTSLGLGTVATRAAGNGVGAVPFVSNALVDLMPVFATATGIRTFADLLLSRAALGIILGTTATNVPTATTNLTNGLPVFATATGVETKTAAAARTALGIVSGLINRVSFENQAAADAGAFNSGLWRTVPLNIKDVDTAGTASLAGNQMTLPAGTYSFHGFMTGYLVDRFQCRLFNVTTASPLKYGTTEESNGVGDDPTSSHVWGRFTISGATVFELQAQCLTSRAGDGFGEAPVFGSPYSLLAGVYFEQEA